MKKAKEYKGSLMQAILKNKKYKKYADWFVEEAYWVKNGACILTNMKFTIRFDFFNEGPGLFSFTTDGERLI